MNFSDNYLAFTQASYSDSLKAIQEAANRILELQNEQLQAVVKNAIAPMQSMLDEAARNIFSNLDISKQLSASIGVMTKIPQHRLIVNQTTFLMSKMIFATTLKILFRKFQSTPKQKKISYHQMKYDL